MKIVIRMVAVMRMRAALSGFRFSVVRAFGFPRRQQ